jgi:hypothetical protein
VSLQPEWFARKILHGDTNKEFSKPTTSMCNQVDKENSGYENFDNDNVATSPLIIMARKADYKSRISFQKVLSLVQRTVLETD